MVNLPLACMPCGAAENLPFFPEASLGITAVCQGVLALRKTPVFVARQAWADRPSRQRFFLADGAH